VHTNTSLIKDVSDTSIWVAYYRAKETERKDALFHDPFAKVLIGDRGKKIAEELKAIGRFTEWTVIARTLIIDDYIKELIQNGVDMVINLGAGLDSRPYRMKLPNTLKWIEVDQPHVIAHKNEILKKETPSCQLKRIALDLSDSQKTHDFLQETGADAKKIVVLTEGVLPYLTEEQVSTLSNNLKSQPKIIFWIAEYFNSSVYKYLKASPRMKKMKNAPFLFYPQDWMGFFESCGWGQQEIRYIGLEGVRHGRKMPMPWWAIFFKPFMSKKTLDNSMKMTGFVLFKKNV
jgi:methyltransferase (TIGR00027 family)